MPTSSHSSATRHAQASRPKDVGVAEGEIKGTALRSLLLGLEHATSRADVERVRAAMPADHRRALEPVVLASKGYPIAVSASIHAAIQRELGGGGCAMNRRAGIEAARIDFRGVYGIFVRIADFPTTLALMDRAWKRYNSRGAVHVHFGAGNQASVRVDGVEGYNEPMWHAIAGRCEGILQLAGARKASATLTAWSPTGCDYELRWVR